jgi:hypothetical protein
MADEFVERTTQGYFSRLGGSIVGVLLGIVLLLVGIGVLYWNEGRAVAAIGALERGAKQVTEIAADRVDPAGNGKLVHLSGSVTVGTPARDPQFGITHSGLLRLERRVEMYQWKEETQSESHEAIGGTKTTETTYTYRKVWSADAIDSSRFKHPTDHRNPAMPIRSQIFDSSDAKLGAYRLTNAVFDQVGGFHPVTPDSSAPAQAGYRRDSAGYFAGTGSPESPAIGDVRISFAAIETQPLSVVAGLSGDTLAAFHESNGRAIVLATAGIASAEAMFQAKEQEERNLTWILRGVGGVAVLIAFLLMARPVSMVLAFLPFLEGIAEAGIFLIAITLSLPVTLLVIAVAWLAHRPLIGGALIAGAGGIFVLLRFLHPRRPALAAPSAGR